MVKQLLFGLLLVVSALQQGSSIEASVDTVTGSTNDLPSSSQSSSINAAAGIQGLRISPRQPSNFDFVNQANWVGTTPDFKIQPRFHVATYTLEFHNDCPQNAITFKFSTTGTSFAYLNGDLIHSWGDPYTKVHTFFLTKPGLLCGCNKIKVIVYNYFYPSPAAMTYSLFQDTAGCYNCDNLGVTFYNKKTCQCQCSSSCKCSNNLMQWSDYPSCGCKCAQIKKCRQPTFFNYQSCDCQCPEKCCPKGTVMNNMNCQCQKVCLRKFCLVGYKWDEEKCDCLPICPAENCIQPFFWNAETCRCECSSAAVSCLVGHPFNPLTCRCQLPKCPWGQYLANENTGECKKNPNCDPMLIRPGCGQSFDFRTCRCPCETVCTGLQTVDPVTCLCIPPQAACIGICRTGETWDDKRCQCVPRTACIGICLPGQSWDDVKCQCVPPQTACIGICRTGQKWDDKLCECVPNGVPSTCPEESCQFPEKWLPEKCRCSCSGANVRCGRFFEWDTERCQCRCQITCIATHRVDQRTCSCVPILV